MGHGGSGRVGGVQDVDGGGFMGVDWPVTGILGLGCLSDYDEISGVTGLRCGVTGGCPTKGVSSGSDAAGFRGEDAVS